MNVNTTHGSLPGTGPVAMASTSLGTVYLYEAAADDVREYATHDALGASGRVCWLLARVGSLGSGPLKDEEVASLGAEEVERLAQQYLDSPQNVRRRDSLGTGPLARGAAESAVAYLDRVLRHGVVAAPGTAHDAGAPPFPSAAPARHARTWSWALAALVMGCLLGGLAALFTWRAYERELAMESQLQAWRAQAQLEASRQAQQVQQVQSQLATVRGQNDELRQRVARLEARGLTRSPDRSPDLAKRDAKAVKPRSKTRR